MNEQLQAELAHYQQVVAKLQETEERYRNIFENAIEGIFQITPDGRFLLANPAMARMLGYDSPAELMTAVTNIRRQLYVYPEDYDRFEAEVNRAHLVRDFEAQFYRQDGTIIWLVFNLQAIRDIDGSLLYYEGTAQDRTERKQIEDALRRREAQLTEVQEMVHLGSWEWDIVANTVTWTDELYRIYGLDSKTFEATFEGYLERVHPDDRERVTQHVMGAVQNCQPFAFKERIVRPDGTIRFLQSIGKVIVNQQGQPIRMVGSCLDITEREEAEQQIRLNAARAEALAKAATSLNAQIELPAVLATICEQTMAALDVPAASVSLYDKQQNHLYHGTDCGLPPTYHQRVQPVAVPDVFTELPDKSFLISPDARKLVNEPNAALYAELDMRTIVSVGLVHESQLMGTLNIHVFKTERAFTEDELTLLKGLGDQAALAIATTRLHAATQEQANQLLTLYKISKDITSILNPDDLLQQIVDRAAQLAKADRALILLVDMEDKRLLKRVTCGYTEDDFVDFDYQEVEDGLSGWVLRERQPVISDDMVNDPRNTGRAVKRVKQEVNQGKFIIVAPLLAREQVIGTLTVINEENGPPFTRGDLELVVLLANQAAVAIENARLYQESQAYAAVLEQRVAKRTAELERQNRALDEARERAEAADRLKSVFLAIMSHELRTPLNSIIGFTGIILHELAGPLNEEQTKQLNMVQDSARHLLSLINDVLDISKIEAGQMTIASEPVEVAAVVEKVVASVMAEAKKKSLEMVVDIDTAVAHITSDERRVEQILINLVNNAVKFTERGEVSVACHVEGEQLLTRVADTGIGIKPEDKAKLFRPFSQIETGLSRPHDGTGLGLAICKRLVEMLGGDIWVQSEPGVGTAFTFTLPLSRTT